MTGSSLIAIAICLVAAALEGLAAGRGVKGRFAQLRQPRHSPPLAVWVGIGLCYYLICFVILSRLLVATRSPIWWAAFVLILVLLIANALWNLVFFRRGDLEASSFVLLAYVALALILAALLSRVDRVSSWVFLPYLLYLAYATWWLLAVRRLNPETRRDAT